MSTTDDTFLVTGAASGIGRCLVGALLARGHRVMAADLDLEALESTASSDEWAADRRLLQAFDIRDVEGWRTAIDTLIETWTRLHVVMNVAGFLRPSWIHECTDHDVHTHFDVNVKGLIFGTRAAAQAMIPQGFGHIINVASLASMAPVTGLGLYVGSKYAVRGFSMAAAQELAPHGIAVSTVCPDAVQTPMLDLQLDYPEAAITFTAPRILTPEDVTQVILGKVLPHRPILISIPRRRAFLARLADLFPSVAGMLTRALQGRGDRIRRKMKGI